MTADLGPTDTEYYDTGLSAETTRYYRVATLSDIGDSFSSDMVMATTQPAEALAQVSPSAQTVVTVGRSTLTFSKGSRASEFQALVSAVAAGCESQDEEGSAPGSLLECLRIEVLDEDGNRESRPRLDRPAVINTELSPVQIADAGGAGELYQQFLRSQFRLLNRRDPGDPWKEVSFRLNVDRGGMVNARIQASSLGDFALVLPAPPTPPTPVSLADVPDFTGPEPEPPATGDAYVPMVVRLALLAALTLLVGGAALSARGVWTMRRREERAAAPNR